MSHASPSHRSRFVSLIPAKSWLIGAVLGAFVFQGTTARATIRSWADLNSDFTSNANWLLFQAPANNTTSDIASFGLINLFQPVLNSNRSVNGLQFTALSIGNVTFSGTGTLTIGNSGINNISTTGLKTVSNGLVLAAIESFTNNGSLTLSGPVANGGNLLTLTGTGANGTLSGILSGTGGLTKSGSGNWVVSGANTYTGATTVSAGTLQITNSGSLGTAANTAATTVANGATLQFANNITTTNLGTLTLNGSGVGGLGALQNASGNNRWNSDVTIASNATIYSATAGNTLYIGNAAYGTNLFRMGSNTVTIDGPGDVWFDSNVGVAGDTGSFVKNGTGKVTFYGSNTFYTGATIVNNGTLDLIVGPFNAGIYGINGSLTIGDNVGASGSAIVNIASNTYAGQISPTSAVTINADGALNIALANSIGALTLNGGQINLAGVALSLTGNVTANTNAAHQAALISGGTLALGGARTFTVARDSTLTSDLTISSAITGGSINKQGAGVMTLTTTNTLTGTTINAGTINAQANNAFGTTNNVTVASGATLQVQGGFSLGQASTTLNGTGTASNGAFENVSGNNTLTGPVTLGSASRIQSDAGTLTISGTVGLSSYNLNVGGAGNTAFNGAISGTGGLTKDGAGTLALGSANTFTGASTISGGTVTTNVTNALNNAALMTINSGGTLNLNNTTQTIGALAGSGTVDFGGSSTLRLTGGSGTFSGSLLNGGTLYLGAGSTLTLGANFNNTGLNIILAGGTLNLNGTNDAFGSITVTGNSVIDFGNSSASVLNSTSLAFNTTSLILTINNWNNAIDYFYTQNLVGATPGARGANPENQISFTGYPPNQTGWLNYDHQITPAPEPSTYGALFVALCLGVVGLRRRRQVAA